MTTDLEPLNPATGREMYLDERSHELADATIQSHRYRLKQFIQWCDQEDIEISTTSPGETSIDSA